MEMQTMCLILSSLSVIPDKSQFYKWESVRLSCEGTPSGSSGWTVLRNTTESKRVPCVAGWGMPENNGSVCLLIDPYPSDSAVYWCESGAGSCSTPVNITVTDGAVVLESPSHGLEVGESLTLQCRAKDPETYAVIPYFNASFYKDGSLIRTESTGWMTIPAVSKSDEGLYKCRHSDLGESPESWLAVRANQKFSSPLPLSLVAALSVSIVVVAVVMLLVVLFHYYGRQKNEPSPTEHIVVYSSLKPGHSADTEPFRNQWHLTFPNLYQPFH